nr:MAG: RNA-dependent RNA polymerase [Hexartovirus sp.]
MTNNSDEEEAMRSNQRAKNRTRFLESTLYPRHLDSPLSDCNLRFWKNNPAQFKKKYRNLHHDGLRTFVHGSIGAKPILVEVERIIRNGRLSSRDGFRSWYHEIIKVVESSLSLQANHAFQSIGDKNMRNLEEIVTNLSNSQEAQTALYYKILVERFHYELLTTYRDGKMTINTRILPMFTIEGDLVEFEWVDSGPVIITYNMLLSVLDKVESSFTFEVLLEILDGIPFYQEIKFKENQRLIYGVLEDAYVTCGSLAAHLFKSLEALACGSVLLLESPRSSSRGFREEVANGITSKCPDLTLYVRKIIQLFDQFIQDYGDKSVTLIMESYGQEKLHFYPFVDEEGGHVKMYRYGTALRSIDHGFVRCLYGSTIRHFIKSYYSVENSMPDAHVPSYANSRILKMFENDSLPSNRILMSIPEEDWCLIHFKKNFEFNYRPDPFDHMQDKAISPDTRNITQIWNRNVRAAYGIPDPQEIQSTRYCEWILDQPVLDVKKYLQEWEDAGGILPHQRLIQCKAKERENKIDSRDYSILHPEVRTTLSTVEYNISKTIFRYYPQQTMTTTGAELTRMTDNLSSIKKSSDNIKISFHLDISQWNYCFRSRMTHHFQEMLNGLFGVSHFDHIMSVFHSSHIYSGNSYDPPLIGGRFTHWENHIGGNQGILQKFWTFITLNIIVRRMEIAHEKYTLIGSGDNQVLSVWLKDDDMLPRRCNEIKLGLDSDFAKVGLEVKLEETWHSAYLLVYRRQYHFKGNPVSLTIKPVCRFSAGISDGYSSVSVHTMTAMGSGQQLSNSSHHPLIGPFLGLFEFLIGIKANPLWSRFVKLSHDQWVALTLVGSGLGPLPVLQLQGLSYSGHKDFLCENLAMIRQIYSEVPTMRLPLIQLLSFEVPQQQDSDFLSLILDPLGPNFRRLPTADSYLKKTVTEGLRGKYMINNKRVNEMFALLDPIQANSLANSLIQIKPLNLSICRALFEYSEIGTVLSVANRFNKMKSIVKVVTRSSMDNRVPSILGVIEKRDTRMLANIKYRFSQYKNTTGDFFEDYLQCHYGAYRLWCENVGYPFTCTYSLRLFLIAYTYRLGDIIPEGPYTPAPQEQLKFHKTISLAERGNALLVFPEPNISKKTDALDVTRGIFSRYVGSTTREPIRTMSLVSLTGSDNAKSIDMLTKLFVWVQLSGADPNLLDFIKKELDCRIDGLSSVLADLDFGASGGCVQHRLSVPGESMGAYLSSLTNISTHYKINSDRAFMFQRGGADYNLFFQECYQYIMASLRFNHPQESAFSVEVKTDCCTHLILPSAIDSPGIIEYPRVNYQTLSQCIPLDTTNIKSLISSASIVKEFNLDHIRDPNTALAAYIGHQVAEHSRTHITGIDMNRSSSNWDSSTSSGINLSIMRGIPMAILIKSVAHALILNNTFGSWSSVSRIKRRVEVLSFGSTGTTDYAEFSPLLEAITTIGKLSELSILAGTSPKWMSKDSDKGLLNIFLRACTNVLFDPAHRKTPYGVLMEYKSNNIVFKKLRGHLSNWNNRVRNKTKEDDDFDIVPLLRDCGGRVGTCDVYVTHSRGDFLEKARKVAYQPLEPRYEEAPTLFRELKTPSIAPPNPVYSYTLRKDFVAFEKEQVEVIPLVSPTIKCEIPYRAFQMARFATNSSGARVKLIETFLRHWGGIKYESERGIFLAEGPGSMLSAFLHFCPDATGYYNSLVTPDLIPSGSMAGFVPPELMCNCGVRNRVENIPYLSPRYGDLATDEVTDTIIQDCGDNANGLLVLDMQVDAVNRERVLQNLIRILQQTNPRRAMIKTSTEEVITPRIQHIIMELSRTGSVVIERLFSSNVWSNEIYIIMTSQASRIRLDMVSEQLLYVNRMLNNPIHRNWGEWFGEMKDALDFYREVTPCSWINPITNNTKTDADNPGALVGKVLLYTLKLIQGQWGDPGSKMKAGTQLIIRSETAGHKQFIANLEGLVKVAEFMYLVKVTSEDSNREPGTYSGDNFLDVTKELAGEFIADKDIPRSDTFWRRVGYLLAYRGDLVPMEEIVMVSEFIRQLAWLPEEWKKSYGVVGLSPQITLEYSNICSTSLVGFKSPLSLDGFSPAISMVPNIIRRYGISYISKIITAPQWTEPIISSLLPVSLLDDKEGPILYVMPIGIFAPRIISSRVSIIVISEKTFTHWRRMIEQLPDSSIKIKVINTKKKVNDVVGYYVLNL